ncbi:MAG TPA: DMT family transporter [Candidatus Acidoferrales bacterium]|nr:DMT family transporter [Candidatus Acidoferrales bacterium]
MERYRHPVLLYSLIVFTILGWSLNFVIAKAAMRYLDVWSMASFRIILSGALMLPIYFWTPRRARFHRKDLWMFIVLAFFGVVMNRGLFILGLGYTTAGHSALIVAVGPIIILLMARMMKLETITMPKVLGMALSFMGVAVLVGGDELHLHSGTWVGDLITLGGTLGFAVYTVMAKKVAPHYDTISMNTFSNLAGAIMLLPLGIRQAMRLDWSSVGWQGWTGLAYTAVISSVIAYLIYFWALKHVSASRLAACTYAETPIAAFLAVLLLGEKPTPALLFGAALILAGVYLAEFWRGIAEVPPDTAGA